MSRPALSGLPAALVAALSLAAAAGAASAQAPKQTARNVILMIADGAGFPHVDAVGLFESGKTGSQAYEQFPLRRAVSTFPAGGGYDPTAASSDFRYVKAGATDSAAAATALGTGVKTSNGSLGVDPAGKKLETVLERAEALGKATGVVTTVPFSHATPAAFLAHETDRDNYPGIAREMILKSAADVIMGAGHPGFSRNGKPAAPPNFRYIGETTWSAVVSGGAGADADGDGAPDPWVLIQTAEQFRRLASGPAPKRVLGVARVLGTLQQERDGDKSALPFQVPSNPGIPTLAEMTSAALNVLDDDPDGLFLLVEGGAVDWAAHANQSGRMVEEMADFGAAVRAVVAWVEKSSNWRETLLVVTADHETGYLTGPGSDPEVKPLTSNGAGRLPGLEWHHKDHTNSLVPLYAKGEAAEYLAAFSTRSDLLRGAYLDNTDVARAIFDTLGQAVRSLHGAVGR